MPSTGRGCTGPIVVRWARDRASGCAPSTTSTATLDPRDLVIADDSPVRSRSPASWAVPRPRSGADTTDVVLEAATSTRCRVAYTARRHRLGSEASRRFERGVDDDLAPAAAQLACDLIAELGAGTPSAIRRPTSTVAPASAALDTSTAACRGGWPVSRTRRESVERRLRDVGCAVDRSAMPARCHAAVVAARPADPGRPGRGGGAARGLRRACRRPLPTAAGRPRADPTAAAAPPDRSRPSPTPGYVEVLTLTVRRRRRPRDGCSSTPTTRARRRSGWQTRCRTRSRTCAPRCCRVCSRRWRATSAAASRRRAVRDRAGLPSAAVPATAARAVGRYPAGRSAARRARRRAARTSRTAWRLCSPGARERAGWWGPGRPAAWSDAVAAAGRSPARARHRAVDVSADRHPPFHPGRCAALHVGDSCSAMPASCTRASIEACGLPAAHHARWRSRSTS